MNQDDEKNDAFFFITYGGIKIDFTQVHLLSEDKFNINDIAHALPMICRFNGHIPFFYSVAQHSIQVSQYLKDVGCSIDVQFCGLLHDAAEAFICDLVSPLKRCIEKYILFEDNIQSMIYSKYGLYEIWENNKLIIKQADNYITSNEMTFLGKYKSESNERYRPFLQDIDLVRKQYIELINYYREFLT